MRLFLLTALTMIAFAANSVLNRMALAEAGMGPASFALVRLAAGAVMLVVLARIGSRPLVLSGRARLVGMASLSLYMLGFSFAYVTLDAGVGALILFGGVQLTMFAGAVLAGERVPLLRWIGAGVAFAGLVWLFWPVGGAAPHPGGSVLMAAAAFGWGIYSLAGRKGGDPLAGTAANFLLAVPVAALAFALLPDGWTGPGLALAVLSGAVTSGLGYALWYSVLPQLASTVAAVAQLTVPVIAVAGGILLLGEELSLRVVISAALVLGGIGLSLLPRKG
ncbi:MAG: DMT family transporter [Rhodobacteraceae bacterium]|nr:DMT family transporter [Paracoccaceae bacterium]